MKKINKIISAITAVNIIFSTTANAAFVDGVTYDKQTGTVNVNGQSDNFVSIALLKEGLNTDSLENVSNENNPYKSIGMAHPENGEYSYTFKTSFEDGKSYLLKVTDGAQSEYEVLGDAYKIYVSNTGSDSYVGSAEKPLKTVSKASELAKAYKAENPVGNIEIILREGTYKITSPIKLNSENSGSETGRITYKAAEGEKAVFSGAQALPYSSFKKVTDNDVLNIIPDCARDKVRVINLPSVGINADVLNIKYNKATKMTAPSELYFNGKKQNIAQWPNAGYSAVGELNEDKNGFSVGQDKAHKWQSAKNAYIQGYIEVPYYRQSHKFTVDTDNNTVTLNNNPSLNQSGKYRIINALEELDMPGEFYTDSENGNLYFYPPKNITYSDDIEISAYSGSFFELNNVSYVNIENIEFKNSGITTDSNGANIATYAVSALNANNVGFKNLVVDNCVGSGLRLSGYNCEISGCDVYNMGGAGISISGGDLNSLTPGNTKAVNNYTYSLSEYQSPHSAGNSIGGVGNTMSNNVFHRSDGSLLAFPGTDLRITNNEFYNGTIETKDSGLLYSQGKFVSYGNEFLYNYFHDAQIPNDNYTGSTAVNNSLYWDNLLSGQTAKYNIFKIGNSENRALLSSGRDNEFTANTVIGGKEVIFSDWTSYYWSAGFGEEGTLTPFAKNGLQELMKIPHGESPWIDRFPQVHQLYNELVTETDEEGNPTKYGLFIPKNAVVDSNLMINTNSNVVLGVGKEAASYKNNSIFGDIARTPYQIYKWYEEQVEADNSIYDLIEEEKVKSMFVDYDNQDLRLTAAAKEEYGFSAELLDENNFDIEAIGNTVKRSVTDSEFSLIYPSNKAKVEPGTVTLKWEQADFADKYTYIVALDDEMTNIVKQGESFDECVQITGLEKNKTYYWTVRAHNLSRQNAKQWNASKIFTFTTGNNDIKVNLSALKGKDGTYAGFDGSDFVIELDIDNIESVDINSKVYVCLYSKDSKLIKTASAEIVIPESSEDKMYIISDSFGESTSEDCTVSVYIWDNSGAMRPLTGKLELRK
ncbi:MAG: hypothetical protein SOZ34_01280 [Clostridia bacterium]|nr:hypothetical protein [Clostridia bacterium]